MRSNGFIVVAWREKARLFASSPKMLVPKIQIEIRIKVKTILLVQDGTTTEPNPSDEGNPYKQVGRRFVPDSGYHTEALHRWGLHIFGSQSVHVSEAESKGYTD